MRWKAVAALGAMTLAAALLLMGTWLLPRAADAVPPDLGDPLLNLWILRWDVRALLTDPFRLFDINGFYPTPLPLARTETLVTVAPLFGLLQAMTGSPVLAYNLTLLCSFWLTAWLTSLLVLRWTHSIPAALLSGVAFAFAPLRFFEIGRIQLVQGMWLPLSLLCWDRLRERSTVSRAAALALVGLAQLGASIYLFAQLAVALLIYAAFDARSMGGRRWLAVAGGAAALTVLLVLPLLYPYLEQARLWPADRPLHVSGYYSAHLRSFLEATPQSLAWGWLSRALLRPGEAQPALFPGAVALALALAALGMRLPRTGRLLAVGLAGAVLALGLHASPGASVPSPYEILYRYLPGFWAFRVPWRFGLLTAFAVACMAGIGLAGLQERWPRTARWLVPVALGLALLEGVSPLPMAAVPPTPPVDRALASLPAGPVLELPMIAVPDPYPYPEGIRLFHSAEHWHPLVNAYPSLETPPTREIAGFAADAPGGAFVDMLVAVGIRRVVVHLDELPEKDRTRWTPLPAGLTAIDRFGSDLLLEVTATSAPLTDQAERALDLPPVMPPSARVAVGILMQPAATWYDGRPGLRRVACSWTDAAGREVLREQVRFLSPMLLRANVPALLPVTLRTPSESGAYRVRLQADDWEVEAPTRVEGVDTAGPMRVGWRVTAPSEAVAGDWTVVRGWLMNVRGRPLPGGGAYEAGECWLAFRWVDSRGRPLGAEERRPLPLDLYAGQEAPWALGSTVPQGAAALEVSVLAWQGEATSWQRLPLRVRPDPKE